MRFIAGSLAPNLQYLRGVPVLTRTKKEQTINTYNGMHESQKHYKEWKPDLQGYKLHDLIYMTF